MAVRVDRWLSTTLFEEIYKCGASLRKARKSPESAPQVLKTGT